MHQILSNVGPLQIGYTPIKQLNQRLNTQVASVSGGLIAEGIALQYCASLGIRSTLGAHASDSHRRLNSQGIALK